MTRPRPDVTPDHDGETLSLAPWRDVLPGVDRLPSLWTGTDLLRPIPTHPTPKEK